MTVLLMHLTADFRNLVRQEIELQNIYCRSSRSLFFICRRTQCLSDVIYCHLEQRELNKNELYWPL